MCVLLFCQSSLKVPNLCQLTGRNKDWLELNVRYTLDVVKGAMLINMVPDFLKMYVHHGRYHLRDTELFPMYSAAIILRFVGEFLTSVPRSTRRALKHLRPVIEHRISQYEKYGKDWPGKPVSSPPQQKSHRTS